VKTVSGEQLQALQKFIWMEAWTLGMEEGIYKALRKEEKSRTFENFSPREKIQ